MNLDQLEKAFDLGKRVRKWLQSLSREDRAALFAHYFVPAILIALALLKFQAIGPFATGYDEILTSIDIKTIRNYEKSTEDIVSRDGLFLIVWNEKAPFKVPFEKNTLKRLWTSLEPRHLKLNQDKIKKSATDVLEINPALFGTKPPFALVAEGKHQSTVAFLGREIPLREFDIISRGSTAIALAILGFSLFGLGLSFNIPAESIPFGIVKQRSGEKARVEDENHVVNRNAE